MKKLVASLFTMVALLLPVTSPAAEKTGVYVAPKFVLNSQHCEWKMSLDNESATDNKTGASAGTAIAVGYDFSPKFALPIRAELEYGIYGKIDKDIYEPKALACHDISVQTLLANVYWDITTWNKFTPYAGAGLGVAFVKTEGSLYAHEWSSSVFSTSDTDTVLAGQVGFGCSYAFNDHISADLGYRFLVMGNGDTETTTYGYVAKVESRKNYAHQVMLGLRVTF